MSRAYKPYQPTPVDHLRHAVKEAVKAVDDRINLSARAVEAETATEPCGTALYKLGELARRIYAPGGGGRLLIAQARSAREFVARVRRSPGHVGPVAADAVAALEGVADAATAFWYSRYERGEKLDGIGELRAQASSLAFLINSMALHARGKFI